MQGKKTGGRVAGTPNKITIELRKTLKGIVADELETDIGEWAEGLSRITRMLDKLVMLVPDEEYDDEDE